MFTARLFIMDEAYQLALQLEKQQALQRNKAVRDWYGLSRPSLMQNNIKSNIKTVKITASCGDQNQENMGSIGP